jgi:propanediol dehydratase small subunit
MPRREQPPASGPDEGSLAAQAHAEVREQVARVREEVLRTRENTLRVTADIAETEQQLAATLRVLAETARDEGRPDDAERLERYAEEALRFAALEERRAAEG